MTEKPVTKDYRKIACLFCSSCLRFRGVTVGDSRWSSSLSSTESPCNHTNAIDVSGLCHNWLFFLSKANDWSSCFSSSSKSYVVVLQVTKT